MKRKIYYWGPFIDKVATIKAIYNSSCSINQYSSIFESFILNVVGEWDEINFSHKKKFAKFLNFKKRIYKSLPRYGFLKSRFSYLWISLVSFFPLKKILERDRPDYLIVHLIVSLPMFLFLFFDFKTKLCLRISGKPKLNLFRKYFWKVASKKIDIVFCPTEETKKYLLSQKIFQNIKIYVLRDPIICLEEQRFNLSNSKKFNPNFIEDNIIMIGRLTKQKNYDLIIDSFNDLIKDHPRICMNIFGDGENKRNLIKKIDLYNLDKRIILNHVTKNVFKYIRKSKLFLLTSLWEDPGFVLIEAAFCNTLILASNCESGPKEFLSNNSGILFENNSSEDLLNKINIGLNLSKSEKQLKVLNSKKKTRHYSYFYHFRKLEEFLD